MTNRGITLVCVDTIDAPSALRALRRSRSLSCAESAILFSDAQVPAASDVTLVRIAPFASVEEYSAFVLTDLLEHIPTTHALIVQWDGFVIDSTRWRDEFLDYDYIGATWPQFSAGRSVGNGGFSLRSRKLLAALRQPGVNLHSPEDLCICHSNRPLLEARFGIRFAPPEVAARFAFERGPPTFSLGFHGLFNFPDVFPHSWSDEIDQLPLRRLASRDAWDLGAQLIAQRRSGRGRALRRILVSTGVRNPVGLITLMRRWIVAWIMRRRREGRD